MTTIYLVRHGENLANVTGEFSYKRVDYPLTARGIAQARQTAEYFRDKPITAIYASPLRRTRETAAYTARALGLPIIVREEFREVNVGDLEGFPPTAASWALHDAILDAWYRGEHDLPYPGGESYTQLLARMRDGLRVVLASHQSGAVIIFGHGGILSATLSGICPDIAAEDTAYRRLANCSITELELCLKDGMPRGALRGWDSCAHLSRPSPAPPPPDAFADIFAQPTTERLLQLGWGDFERFVATLFERAGYAVEHVALRHGSAFDLALFAGDPAGERSVAFVSVKHVKPPNSVTAAEVRAFGVALANSGGASDGEDSVIPGYLVSATDLTPSARHVAAAYPRLYTLTGGRLITVIRSVTDLSGVL